MFLKSRFLMGNNVVSHKGETVNTPVGTIAYDTFIKNIDSMFTYEIGTIPAGVEHRPDLISNIFYGTPAYWWLLMAVNSVPDPFEGFNVGDRILIPNLL